MPLSVLKSFQVTVEHLRVASAAAENGTTQTILWSHGVECCCAGMTPVYLKYKYKANGVFHDARSVLAIHNLAHQGTSLAHQFKMFHLPEEAYSELEWIYTEPDGRTTPVRSACTARVDCTCT